MKLLWLIKNLYLSFFSKKTIGARSLVVKDDMVLLIYHTYTDGWHTIGGGVDSGETFLEAVKRELKEEVGITTNSDPKLFNVYYNNSRKHDDYVAFYICDDFTENDYKCASEIKEKKWFKMNELPQDISPATKRRIDEYLGVLRVNGRW